MLKTLEIKETTVLQKNKCILNNVLVRIAVDIEVNKIELFRGKSAVHGALDRINTSQKTIQDMDLKATSVEILIMMMEESGASHQILNLDIVNH